MLITSAVRADGKSTVTANLGLSIAQTERKVIIIDANLRYPMIHKLFKLENDRGLTNLLNKEIQHSEAIQKSFYPGVSIITSGPTPPNPVELLSSTTMNSLLDELENLYDVILVDSPPSLTVTDPAVLAPKVSGTLVVVRAGWVRREALQATMTQLDSVNANLFGIISNRTELGIKSRFSKTQIRPAVEEQVNDVQPLEEIEPVSEEETMPEIEV